MMLSCENKKKLVYQKFISYEDEQEGTDEAAQHDARRN